MVKPRSELPVCGGRACRRAGGRQPPVEGPPRLPPTSTSSSPPSNNTGTAHALLPDNFTNQRLDFRLRKVKGNTFWGTEQLWAWWCLSLLVDYEKWPKLWGCASTDYMSPFAGDSSFTSKILHNKKTQNLDTHHQKKKKIMYKFQGLSLLFFFKSSLWFSKVSANEKSCKRKKCKHEKWVCITSFQLCSG